MTEENEDCIDYNEEEDYINEEINSNSIYIGEDIFLEESELLKEREKIIKEAMEKLCLERNDAILAMIYLKWDEELIDTWYDDPDNNKIKSGLELSKETKEKLSKKGVEINGEYCLVCFKEKDDKFLHLNCGHEFCDECWKEYLKEKIKNPLGALSVNCPQEGCTLVVNEEIYKKFLCCPEEENKNYPEIIKKMIFRDFINKNKDLKQCPNPKCHFYIKSSMHSEKEINCPCGVFYCFKCSKISHRPCSCEMVEKWDKKRGKETPDELYIKAYTKECPFCHKRIEKNQGCNFMLCDQRAGGCGKAFCYVCGTDWTKHTQDHFGCNKYTDLIKKKENESLIIKNELIKKERYNFYYTRFLNYEESVKVINDSLRKTLKEKLDIISGLFNIPLTELSFISEAFKTIYKNKIALKNTYIFGYFMKNDKKDLFEFKQGLLELNVEKLHKHLIDDFIDNMIQAESLDLFNTLLKEYKDIVLNLISTINRYSKNLFEEFENYFLNEIDSMLYENF